MKTLPLFLLLFALGGILGWCAVLLADALLAPDHPLYRTAPLAGLAGGLAATILAALGRSRP